MRVLHVVHGYAPAVGGTQRMIQNISERLVAEFGDDVTVFTTTAYNNTMFWRTDQPELAPGIEQINGVTVRRFPVFNRWGRLRFWVASAARRLKLPYSDWLLALYHGPLIWRMTGEIARTDVDLVVASAFPLLHMHYALWGAKRARVPIVFIGAIHAADSWGYDRAMIYSAIRQADAYIAYTTFERDYLIRKGIPESRLHVIGAGLDSSLYGQADGRALRARHGWSDDLVVAVVAQHAPHKRIDTVIQAMREVWQRFPTARLLIAGARTAYSTHLDELIAKLPTAERNRVTSIDDFAEQEKPLLFSASDLLVNPSSHESFGLVFLEAWACGKPVVGARAGAVPSVVTEGVDGLLVRPGDAADLARAIQDLLGDTTKRAQLGDSGRRKVLTHFTWDVVIRRFHDVYRGVIQK